MAATLATLRDRVETMLADSGNAIWSSDDIDEGIRQALHEYSKTRPLKAESSLTLSATGREIDISSLTGLLDVSEIWCNYTASDPEFPPNRRAFMAWADLDLLYVIDDYEPASGDVMRVFHTKLQTLTKTSLDLALMCPSASDVSQLVIPRTYSAKMIDKETIRGYPSISWSLLFERFARLFHGT